MLQAPPSLPFHRRLSFKYARMAVVIALLLGSVLAAIQVYFDIQQERDRVERLGASIMWAVAGPAARASYRLDPIVSQEIVDGLLHNVGMVQAEIIDDFGDGLATAVRTPEPGRASWLGYLVGHEPIRSTLDLYLRKTFVGRLEVLVDPVEASPGLTQRVAGLILAGIGKSLLLSIILFAVFYYMGTKRVLSTTARLFETEADLPQSGKGDELDQLEMVGRSWRDRLLELAAEVSASEKRLQLAAESAAIGVWEYEIATNTLFWDKGMFRIFGVDEKDFTGAYEDWRNTLHPDDAAEAEAMVQQALLGIKPLDITFRIRTPRGEEKYIKANAVVLKEMGGQATRMIGTNYDMTKEVRAEQDLKASRDEAEQANQAKTEFLASMSHELRTPLNAILGYSQFLELNPRGDLSPQNLEYVSNIRKGGEYLLSLINRVLDLAKIEANQVPISLEDIDARDLVLECIERVRPLLEAKNLAVSVSVGDAVGYSVKTDRICLSQVVLNVLSNAIKFNRANGALTISVARTPDDFARIDITDTGQGIPPDRLSQVFNKFERGLRDPSLAAEGAGIGLAIVKELLDRLGGRVVCESTIDVGTTFSLFVPLTTNDEMAIWTKDCRLGRADDESICTICNGLFDTAVDDNARERMIDEVLVSVGAENTGAANHEKADVDALRARAEDWRARRDPMSLLAFRADLCRIASARAANELFPMTGALPKAAANDRR